MGGLWKELEDTSMGALELMQFGMFQMIRNPLFLVSVIGLLVVQNNNIKFKVGKLLDIQL